MRYNDWDQRQMDALESEKEDKRLAQFKRDNPCRDKTGIRGNGVIPFCVRCGAEEGIAGDKRLCGD